MRKSDPSISLPSGPSPLKNTWKPPKRGPNRDEAYLNLLTRTEPASSPSPAAHRVRSKSPELSTSEDESVKITEGTPSPKRRTLSPKNVDLLARIDFRFSEKTEEKVESGDRS
jgi:hypothetical protein